MTNHEGTDLLARVERYETALAELRAAHADVKDIVFEHVLFERWQRLGAELGFPATAPAVNRSHAGQRHGDPASLDPPMAEMSESWAG